MIVHMQKSATKLHTQRLEAAKNVWELIPSSRPVLTYPQQYDRLLERLGSDADKVAPSFTAMALSSRGESRSAGDLESTSMPSDLYS